MKSKYLLAGLLATALALPLAACGSGDSGGDGSSTPITLTISEAGEGTKSLTEAAGVFKDAGYKVEWAHFDTGPAMLAAIASGNVDLSYVGGLPPIVSAASGLDFRVVAGVVPVHPELGGHNLLVEKDSGIDSLEELRGKTIGVPKSTSPHAFVVRLLNRSDIDLQDVKFAYLEPTQLGAALFSGRIDAAAAWEVNAAPIRGRGAKVLATDEGPDFPRSAFMATSVKDLDDPARRAAVTDAIERTANAHEWALTHEKEHAEAVAKDSGIPLDEAQVQIKGKQLTYGPITSNDIRLNQETADMFFQIGEIPMKVDFNSVVDNILN
ncbi:ABC transporter substrate-binding protein [Rhodococcus opacus]|uniref:ABC transporter substrate-binding protein n=1 Tax=Rhodococcus opacus TaxID=37919 RepID=UPI001300B579|nr:ABC transporter substrate-binding protein [Rhodococcus opacus]